MNRLLALALIFGMVSHAHAGNPAWFSAGGEDTCVAFGLTQVYCWGRNDSGELGNGSTSPAQFPTRVRDSGGAGFLGARALAAGTQHTCARRSVDDRVVCWGANDHGQLGDAATAASTLPQLAFDADGNALTGAIALSAGGQTSCATIWRPSDGHIACWGANAHGQLGANTFRDASEAFVLATPGSVSSVSSGTNHTCSLSDSQDVYCWGSNATGQLGTGSTSDVDSAIPPTAVSIGSIESMSSGLDFSCAVSLTGNVFCWGVNSHMQMDEFPSTHSDATPHRIGSLDATFVNLVGVVSGESHACALKNDGTVFCWGHGREGELGNDKTADFPDPQPVLDAGGVNNLSNVAALAAGATHTCAAKTDGTVWCWGDNTYGQLGDGTHTSSPLPVPVNFDAIFRDGYE